MVKHKDAYDGDLPLADLASEIDNKHEENKKNLTVRQKREQLKKAKSFTTRWGQGNFEATMKALYDEVARLAGRMERWKMEELRDRQMRAMEEYHTLWTHTTSPFDLVDEAVRIKANIPRLRYRADKDIPNDIRNEMYGPDAKNDSKKIAKLEAEAERIRREKMPAAAFRIYEIWCTVGAIIQTDADARMAVKLSDYEDYDFEYKEEDL
jgi:hypothetical protein